MKALTVLKTSIADVIDFWQLPPAARKAHRKDRKPLPIAEPGSLAAIHKCLDWLCRAQDHSTTKDGGVARHYSLVTGWGPSYPETTGYIIPTMLDCAEMLKNDEYRTRAKRMLDWLVSIQLDNGAFQAGTILTKPCVPTPFNTGQILIGLAKGVKEFGQVYLDPAQKAANWLVSVQDSDGCWRKYPSPLVAPGEKSYDTHLAIGLIEAERLEPAKGYLDCAIRNVRWSLKCLRPNGWIEKCCLEKKSEPLTHTLGYALRGILEAFVATKNSEFLAAAVRTAGGLLKAMRPSDGFIPGRIDENWQGTVSWSCLTGTAQISFCWMMLYEILGKEEYLAAARLANKFVRRTIKYDGDPDIMGGVKGSQPINGKYGTYEYLNWACKFVIDANLMELKLAGGAK